MKKFILIACLISCSSAVLAGVPAACDARASRAVEKAEPNRYDKDGFWTNGCEFAENKGAVICEVVAMKGDEAASDTYRVVLNKTCTKVFRVELTGEE